MAGTLPPPAPLAAGETREARDARAAADARSAERAAITLRVDYKRINTFFADYTRNISKGGTFIRTAKPLEVGTEFVFVLTFPARDSSPDLTDRHSSGDPVVSEAVSPHPESLELRGRVVWTVPEANATDEHPAGMGIRFLFESDEARVQVDDYVERLMKETLGEHLSERLLRSAARASDPGSPPKPPAPRER